MTNLDQFIRENRSAFDDAEPPEGHFERFSLKLEQMPDNPPEHASRFRLLRVAAVILLLITVSAVFFEYVARQAGQALLADHSTEMNKELLDAIHYYDLDAAGQLEQLYRLTSGKPDAGTITGSMQQELNDLDASITDLKRALKENPGNERIYAAIIMNRQMKNTILNNMIRRLSDQNNQ